MAGFEYAPADPQKMMGTPRGLLPHVLDFCKTVAPGQDPFFVDVNFGPDDTVNECITNVRNRISNDGGEIVLGWQIWEWYGVEIEAELHALWRRKDGVLQDVTPKQFPCEKIIFLPDPSLVYEERQVDNRRAALLKEQAVLHYIGFKEATFKIMNKGERAGQHGAIILEGEEAALYQEIMAMEAGVVVHIMKMAQQPDHTCRCGSGFSFKECHGVGV